MNEKNKTEFTTTISLRNFFAGQALQGRIAGRGVLVCPAGRDVEEWRAEVYEADAVACFAIADAMMAGEDGSLQDEIATRPAKTEKPTKPEVK